MGPSAIAYHDDVPRVQLIDRPLIDQLVGRARQSPRRRMNHNFHASLEENPSRFLNIFLRGSYVRPHRHIDPPKSESFIVLEGRLAVFIFDDDGRVTRSEVLAPDRGVFGVDLDPGVWHTVTAVSREAICFEVKPGPYVPASDKDFASWAPGESDPAAAAYLETLVQSLE